MFDRFADRPRRDWKRRALILGSLALHGVLAAALLLGSWLHVAELTPPLLSVVFWSAPEPPPPPPAGKPKSHPHATAKRSPAAVTAPAPRLQPTPIEPSPSEPSDTTPEGPPGPPGPPGPRRAA